MNDYSIPVPPGKYRARAVSMDTDDGPVKANFDVSPEKGTEFVKMNFEIIDGEFAGRRVFWNGYFSSTVMKSGRTVAERTMESLRACGWTGDNLMEAPFQLLDGEVEIDVTNETSQKTGKAYAKVDWVNRTGGGGAVKIQGGMNKDKLRDFAARMKVQARGIPEIGTPKAAAPAPNGAPKGDDEIPF